MGGTRRRFGNNPRRADRARRRAIISRLVVLLSLSPFLTYVCHATGPLFARIAKRITSGERVLFFFSRGENWLPSVGGCPVYVYVPRTNELAYIVIDSPRENFAKGVRLLRPFSAARSRVQCVCTYITMLFDLSI